MSQGTTPGGSFRYPYEFTAIAEQIRDKLAAIGMDHDWTRLVDDFIAHTMDRDRALEDYATYAAGSILFATVDGGGAGDYTSIKAAVEAVATYSGTSEQAFSVIYVKPFHNSGLGYAEQGAGNVTIPSNTAIMLWAGGMEGNTTYLGNLGAGMQRWQTDGFIIPSGSASTLAIVGFRIELGTNKAICNNPSTNPTAPIYMENCQITASVGYGLMIPTRFGGTWYFKNCAFNLFNQNGTIVSSAGALSNTDITAVGCNITFGPTGIANTTTLTYDSTATAIIQCKFIDSVLSPPSSITNTLTINGGGWSGTGGSNWTINDCYYGLGDLQLNLSAMAVHINGWHMSFKRDSDSPYLDLRISGNAEQVSPAGATAGTGFTCTNVVLPFCDLTLTDSNMDTAPRTSFFPGLVSGQWKSVTVNACSQLMDLVLFNNGGTNTFLTVNGHYNNIRAVARTTNFNGSPVPDTIPAAILNGHDNRLDITAQHFLTAAADYGYNNVINGGLSGTPLTTALFDAKGDLIAGFADQDVRRLAVGTNGQRLTARSTEPLGLKYEDPTFFSFDANGDLLVGTGDNTYIRLPLAASGRILRARPDLTGGGVSWDYQRTLNNRLTQNQASLETDTAGWTAESGCTIARSTAKFSHGAASLEITKS